MKICQNKILFFSEELYIIIDARYLILKLYFQKGLIACNFLYHQNVEPMTPQKHCFSVKVLGKPISVEA